MKLIMESWRKFLREGDLVSDPMIIARLVINGSVYHSQSSIDDAYKLMKQTGIKLEDVIRILVEKLMSDRESALEYEKSLNMSTPLGPGQPTLEEYYKINDKWRALYEDIYYFAKGEDPESSPPVNWPYIKGKEWFVNLYRELSSPSEKQLAEGYSEEETHSEGEINLIRFFIPRENLFTYAEQAARLINDKAKTDLPSPYIFSKYSWDMQFWFTELGYEKYREFLDTIIEIAEKYDKDVREDRMTVSLDGITPDYDIPAHERSIERVTGWPRSKSIVPGVGVLAYRDPWQVALYRKLK